MSLTGKIMNFFADKEMTIPAFPKTKVKAVSDDNGIGLNVLLDNIDIELDSINTELDNLITFYTANLSMDDWTNNTDYASQTITVSGILASDNPIVDINTAGLTATGMQAVASAWCEVYYISTATNSITVYSRSVPTTDIPIKLMVVR